jgi:hypothetical protein
VPDDEISTVVSSMDQLTSTTIKAGIEFQGLTKSLIKAADTTSNAGKKWTVFSRLVSGTPIWAAQNKMRAYLAILGGFEQRSKANGEAAINARKKLVDSIKGYQALSEEYLVLDKAAVKAASSTNDYMASIKSIKDELSKDEKDDDFLGKSAIDSLINIDKNLKALSGPRLAAQRKLVDLTNEAIGAIGFESLAITKQIRKQEMIIHNSKERELSLGRTVVLLKNLDEKQLEAIKNTLAYQRTLLATGDENLAIRRGKRVLDAKKTMLDKEHKMRVHNSKLAYAQDEERIKMAVERAKELADVAGYGYQVWEKGFMKRQLLERRAKKETQKKMKGEMNDLAGVELENTLKSIKDNMIGSVKNMIPLLAPIGVLLKVSKLSLSALNLRSMTAAKFQIFVLKFVKGLQPIMKMMMMYLIYAILFIVAAAVIFKYLKEFYDILKRFGVIEEIKQLGKDVFNVAKTFYKAIESFIGGDYQKGLDYIIEGAEKLLPLMLKAGKLALKIGFLALVAGFGTLMKFIKELSTSPELQAKVGKILMYVGIAVAGFLVLQLLLGFAATALAFLALPALIILGIVAALFAIQYYFKEELDTFVDYLRAALEPIGKVLEAVGNFVTVTVPYFIGLYLGFMKWFYTELPFVIGNFLLSGLEKLGNALLKLFMAATTAMVEYVLKPIIVIATGIWGVILNIKKSIEKIRMPKLSDLPFMANGGVSKGGMTVVGERGPELVNLSKGSRVFSNSESRKMVSSSGTVNNFNITINAKDTSKAEMRRIANELGNMINNKMNRTGATRTMR